VFSIADRNSGETQNIHKRENGGRAEEKRILPKISGESGIFAHSGHRILYPLAMLYSSEK
jgi:hypothetical protein